MLKQFLTAYAARIRSQRQAHPDISEPALAPEFQRLLTDCLFSLPAASLAVVPEFQKPGAGRPDIALKRPGEPPRAFIELKQLTKPADPERWKDAHDKRQFARLQSLGCWAACNFFEIRLFEHRDEVAAATIVPKAALDPATSDAKADKLITAHDDSALVALLTRLAHAQAPSATNAQGLAANLAHAARLIRGIVAERLAEMNADKVADHPLLEVRGQFRDVLYAHPEAGGYPDASFDELFAAAFAQTLAFGLLLVREGSGQPVDNHAADHMPDEHPLMKTALQVLTLPQIVDDLGIGFEVMLDTVNSFAAELLVPQEGGRDPILYFYEDFLAVFDPRARERYGVYYTPVEVVRYMVGALDRALRDDLGTEGLRDPAVTLLDPAVGTGTFLLGVAERVRAQAAGPGMAHLDLLDLARRMYGFELLVGPYAVAHYRLHHALRPPVKPGNPLPEKLPRLGIYLADTLARPESTKVKGVAGGFLFKGIAEERAEASRIKSEQPILAIIGNPPYRRLEAGENETLVGRWMDERWDDLKKPVRDAGWGGELNTFPELSVAFWRWAMWKLFEAENAPKHGVVAFITNRKFLTGHPYAGLRKMMRERFDRIEVIDLRGDVRRGERAGVANDQGVFNIQVGTCITLAVADGSRAEAEAKVRYTDAWGAGLTSRPAKLGWLQNGADAGSLQGALEVTREALDDLRPGPFEGGAWVSLVESFVFARSGMQTKRDSLVYANDKSALTRKIKDFLHTDAKSAAELFHDTRDRKWPAAKAHDFDADAVIIANYRPLDRRFLYLHRAYGDFLRPELQSAWGSKNVGLYSMSFGTGHGPAAWVTSDLPDYHSFSGRGGYAFPLYDRRSGGDQSNLSPALLAGLAGAYGIAVEPQDVFDAMLTLLSASSYTTRFAEDLEDVFPHVPFPGEHRVFLNAAAIGREIRGVETFVRKPGPTFLTDTLARVETIPSAGPLGAVEWRDGGFALRPDGSGGVTGVPEAVWRFQVSGYRLLPRWLAAREGQPVDKALIEAMRDVAGRIAELIHQFDAADLVLADALAHTLTRGELGLAPAPVEDESDQE